MNQETFFENFELLAEAPNGVQKLRELILQLAVQGKLLPQDPYDESALVLLQRIKREKRVSKGKGILPVNSEDCPFKLPELWKWVRFRDIVDFNIGRTPKTKVSEYWNDNGIPWVSIADMQHYGTISTTKKSVSYKAAKEVFRVDPVKAGTILMSFKLTIGKISILGIDAYHNEAIISIHPAYLELRDFLYRVLPQAAIGGETKGAIKGQTLNSESLTNLLIPLPPIQEQQRIVAKVDQLMALCDQLEARQQEKHDNRIRLNNAALYKLLTAPTPEEFAQYWQRICDNFNLLYDAPETVGQLRQAILQLAVQGKLVPPDSNDEAASDFLKRICDQHTVVGVQFDEDTITLPKIPDKWIWSRCEQLCQPSRAITYGVIKLGQSVDGGVPILRSSNVRWLHIDENIIKHISPTIAFKYSRTFLEGGEILVTVRGTLGGVAVVPLHMKGFNISREVAMIPIKHELDSRFVCFAMASLWSQNWLHQVAKGIAYTGINIKDLKRLPLPIPPLQEQKRIVAKVDQLMALCDELEAGLVQAQTGGGKLMEAVVHHVLAG